jgi:hypothetical protein
MVFHMLNRGVGRRNLFTRAKKWAELINFVRLWQWSAYIHKNPEANELSAIRRSSETDLPYGDRLWV